MSRLLVTEYGTISGPDPQGEAPDLKVETFGPSETSPHPGQPALGSGPKPAEMFGHYRILRQLGAGGMGQVFEAEDQRLQRRVALKVMHREMTTDPAACERFLREARAVAAVRNDHVITVYEVDQVGETPYIAMELLQGQTLDAWIRSGGVAAVSDVLRIGREVATGLAAAQERGLVHRDIKPANLWMDAGSGRVKILDFGLARPVDRQAGLTRTGAVVGTPYFMAPEQAVGNPVDGRSDLFSLGVVLYRLCAGQLPFHGNNVTAVLLAVTSATPRPVQEANAALPPALAQLIMRLLAKDPGQRPESAAAVAAMLHDLEAGTPPPAASRPLPPAPAPSRVTRLAGSLPALRSALLGPRRWLYAASGLMLAALVAAAACWGWHRPSVRAEDADDSPGASASSLPGVPTGPPVRLGILYSRTGTLALSERPILEGALLAVDEINEQGGLLGRRVEPVIENGRSDPAVFSQKAGQLIGKDHVAAIVGCYTSACRKAVKAVVERQDHLLLYPVAYEGMEKSAHVLYGGAVPNQHILPALQWSYGFLNKKRWFLVGLDSLFPRAAHAIIRDEARRLGSTIVGEEFLVPGTSECGDVARKIAAAHADLVLNTVSGDTNVALFRSLRQAGVYPDSTPVLSFRLTEVELASLSPTEITGQYAAGTYFQSLDTPANQAFLARLHARFGPDRIVTDPMETAYYLVQLWARAVRAAGTLDPPAVRAALKHQQFNAPQGPVTIDPATMHLYQVGRIGQVNASGHFQEVFVSPQPLPPQPFPPSRSRQAWKRMIEHLRLRWGGRWESPGL